MTTSDAGRVSLGGATDVGLVRQENEDSYGVWGPENGDWDFLIAVADGVGGHEHGKQASELAISAFSSKLAAKPLPRTDTGLRDAMLAALAEANAAVYRAFTGEGTGRPGSTFTCVLGIGGKCFVGHVGDSRAYMIHSGQIFQLSTDHTWVQSQVATGTMTPEEAASSPYRNQVLKVLGVEPEVEADVVVRTGSPGDVFIVCSDGVTEHVDSQQLLRLTLGATDARELAKTVVAQAVAGGGSDNATAVVAGMPVSRAGATRGGRANTTVETPALGVPPVTVAAGPKASAGGAPQTVTRPSTQAAATKDPRSGVAMVLIVVFVVLAVVLVVTPHRRPAPTAAPSTGVASGPSAPTPMAVPPPAVAPPAVTGSAPIGANPAPNQPPAQVPTTTDQPGPGSR